MQARPHVPADRGRVELRDGQNELVVTAIDRAGRQSPESDVYRFRADAVRPEIAFSAPAADHRQTSRTVAFAFSAGEAGATYGCRLDGGAVPPLRTSRADPASRPAPSRPPTAPSR